MSSSSSAAPPPPLIGSFDHFLLWERSSRDTIEVKRVYIDMAGDLAAGVLLSQIVYWHLPNDQGQTRLRVEADGHLWLVKGYGDWWDECRLTFKQARRAIETLAERGLIVLVLRKFAGAPKCHIRINRETFLSELNRFALEGKSTCPPGQIHLPPGASLTNRDYKQRLPQRLQQQQTRSRRPRSKRPARPSVPLLLLLLWVIPGKMVWTVRPKLSPRSSMSFTA